MSTTLEVHVSKEDIAKGIRHNCYECMVALAFGRIFPKCTIAVGRTHALVESEGDEPTFTYDLPNEATVAITDFDNGKPIVPFTFTATKRS